MCGEFCRGGLRRPGGLRRLLEPGWVAGAPADDLGFGSSQVDHGSRFGAAVTRVDDRVDRVIEPLLDLPALGQRFGLIGEQQRRRHQRLRQLGEHCLRDGVRGKPIAEILKPDEDDYFVLKPKHSGFQFTTLDVLLAHLGAKTLILTGVAVRRRNARRIGDLERAIWRDVGNEFNIGSTKQLGDVLFEKLGLPGGRKGKTGAYGTDAAVLEQVQPLHPVPGRVLEWRQLTKLKSTYTDALQAQINDAGIAVYHDAVGKTQAHAAARFDHLLIGVKAHAISANIDLHVGWLRRLVGQRCGGDDRGG